MNGKQLIIFFTVLIIFCQSSYAHPYRVLVPGKGEFTYKPSTNHVRFTSFSNGGDYYLSIRYTFESAKKFQNTYKLYLSKDEVEALSMRWDLTGQLIEARIRIGNSGRKVTAKAKAKAIMRLAEDILLPFRKEAVRNRKQFLRLENQFVANQQAFIKILKFSPLQHYDQHKSAHNQLLDKIDFLWLGHETALSEALAMMLKMGRGYYDIAGMDIAEILRNMLQIEAVNRYVHKAILEKHKDEAKKIFDLFDIDLKQL